MEKFTYHPAPTLVIYTNKFTSKSFEASIAIKHKFKNIPWVKFRLLPKHKV